jgi:glycosyltransferase involved in cell wall biosynthesis
MTVEDWSSDPSHVAEASVMSVIGFVSTYQPTLCGLATFSASLYTELVTNSASQGRVVRVVDTPQPRTSREVVAELVAGDPSTAGPAVAALESCDVVIVQHEYGIYGGPDGDEVLPFLAALAAPKVVVLHTVLSEPTAHQRVVLDEVAALADVVVVMTGTARDRLARLYSVDMHKVRLIPHGAPAVSKTVSATIRSAEPTILTWGLLGPSKGIQWGIAAMAHLQDIHPTPRYVVAGQTHPKVLDFEGERYRNALTEQTRDLRLEHCVTLDNQYRSPSDLAVLVSSADLVLLPYDSTDQVTSGVLIEAVAAGKPVVATRFPHAIEQLSDGGGILVRHKDPLAIADALREVLAHRSPARLTSARTTTTPLLWSAVADRYRDVVSQLKSARSAA